jgi:hypothetical protein
MASNTVEQIFVELLLNAKGYSKEADDAVKKSEKLEKGLGNTEKQSVKTNKSFDGLVGGLRKAVKGVAGLTAVIAAGTGLLKLADEARKANDELNFLSKNLGMSSGEVKAWQGAAAAMGGSAQGMAGDMKALNSSMNDFVMTGESSMLPMFNTLGVSMVNAQGKVRDTNEVLLDVADSFSKMDREQAALMGQKMGFDEGTINTLLQGRDAMQEMVDYHKQMYTSNKQEMEASRKLSENQAKLGAHWDSMKLMMGNAIIPLLVKLSNVALRFFEFLQRHQKTVKTVFEGMAIFLGMLVVPLLGKALVAALLFMAPFLPFIATVGLLGAAFIALYQDYKVWAEGGDSLFNWGAFSGYIDNAKFSTENLGKGFLHLIGDYKSWSEVAEDGKSWLKLKGFIDENGVSLKTLRAGFIDLAGDIVKYAIPTLKGYAEILQKLVNGDFKGAAWQSAQMFQNLGDSIIQGGKDIWNRATESVDITTGQPMGTLGSTSIMNNGKHSGLGSVSAKYEGKIGSANRDVDQNGNPAGWAYGKFQFNSAKGGLQKFFSDNPSVAKQFSGLTPGSTAFNNKWKQLAKADPKGFEVAQNKSAENLWYNPARDAYGKAGFDMSNRGVQEAVFSSSIQHGGVVRNLLPLIKKQVGGDISKLSAEEQIKAIYKGRTAYHKRGASRYSSEMQDALAISRGATQAQSAMPKNQIPASIAKPVTNNKSNNVEVNVNKIEVNTSSSTMTGTMADAMNGLKNNNFYQFSMGPQ